MLTDQPSSLLWVREVAGQARLRWGRIAAFFAAILAGELFGSLVVGRFTGTATNPVVLLAMLCGPAAYLVIVVELQLTRLRSGVWRFHYSLRAILILTAIAASFFGLTSYAYRENQRAFAFNAELKRELEAVIQDGVVSISNPGGRGILCQVARPSFSDDDLAKVIALASRGGTGSCELEHLFLEATSVTSAGICQLAGCEKLVFVALPPIALNTAAIKSLAKCKRLEAVLTDERKLSAKQLDQLRKALPRILLNGRTWAQRDGR